MRYTIHLDVLQSTDKDLQGHPAVHITHQQVVVEVARMQDLVRQVAVP